MDYVHGVHLTHAEQSPKRVGLLSFTKSIAVYSQPWELWVWQHGIVAVRFTLSFLTVEIDIPCRRQQ
jgi:hypothetical protein